MRSFLRLALVALPLISPVTLAETPAENSASIYANAQEAFQDLLNALPDESLQAALTSLTKFKAGVFESHRRGVEHVHNDNPPLATKLIVEAVRDLTRRQQPANGTSADPSDSQTVNTPQSSQAPPPVVETSQGPPASTTNNPPATTDSPPQTTNSPPQTSNAPPQSNPPASNPPESNSPANNPPPQTSARPTTPTNRPVVVPVVATTTDREGRTLTSTTSVLSEVTASVQVTVTRTNAAGSTVTTAEFKPAVIKTTTDAQGRASAVTSAANFAPTKGEVITSTNAEGSTFLTTYTPDGGRVSSLKLITTTDAEGRPSTITSYSYVDPTAEGGDNNNSGQSEPTRTGTPGVQNGAAGARSMQYAMAGGALGLWAVFF